MGGHEAGFGPGLVEERLHHGGELPGGLLAAPRPGAVAHRLHGAGGHPLGRAGLAGRRPGALGGPEQSGAGGPLLELLRPRCAAHVLPAAARGHPAHRAGSCQAPGLEDPDEQPALPAHELSEGPHQHPDLAEPRAGLRLHPRLRGRVCGPGARDGVQAPAGHQWRELCELLVLHMDLGYPELHGGCGAVGTAHRFVQSGVPGERGDAALDLSLRAALWGELQLLYLHAVLPLQVPHRSAEPAADRVPLHGRHSDDRDDRPERAAHHEGSGQERAGLDLSHYAELLPGGQFDESDHPEERGHLDG
mmetsp:Transcript_107717/g.257315  ORF Transcript_107717/g.257315 Transcript_107717/m.257315 type:complete len:305 (+) Transcript_107717:3449-4363(+)